MAVGVFIYSYIVIYVFPCLSAGNMSGHMVGGQYSEIRQFPYSIQLFMHFYKGNIDQITSASCGGSILNQVILLTAAHCFEIENITEIISYAGHKESGKGLMTKVLATKMHENYFLPRFDIALVLLEKELRFGDNIRRILLVRHPPYDQPAITAGWGQVWAKGPDSHYLKHVSLTVYTYEECLKMHGGYLSEHLHEGAFCTKHKHKEGWPTYGDSGCALVNANVPVQLGIQSFSIKKDHPDITVFTDVGYFYDWIMEHSRKLYCNNNS